MAVNICAKCEGYGSISTGSGFYNEGEAPPVSKTCDECSGTGQVSARFFVEFIFDYELTRRKYWLPLFILTDNAHTANDVTTATKKALKEHFKNVEHSRPIPKTTFSTSYINQRYNLHRNQKLAILNVDVWKFTDVDPNPKWSFDEHLEFIVETKPYEPRTIAECVESHRFPVRIIKDGQFPLNFNEFLLINLVH